jgi:hypothetical protein
MPSFLPECFFSDVNAAASSCQSTPNRICVHADGIVDSASSDKLHVANDRYSFLLILEINNKTSDAFKLFLVMSIDKIPHLPFDKY